MDGVLYLQRPGKRKDSVSQWLSELRNMTEIECMSVLQGKPLQSESHHSDPSENVKKMKDGIDALKEEADKISEDFAEMFRCFEEGRWTDLSVHTREIAGHIRSLIKTSNARLKDIPVYILEQQEMVSGESAKLTQQAASFCQQRNENSASKIPLVNQLTFLGQSFSRLVDSTLGLLVQRMVDCLDNGCGLPMVHAAVSCIIGLGLEGEHMCFIISREGGVRALLDLCRRETMTFTRSHALRALATICCAPECIAEFERERGIELLVELLCETGPSRETVQGEAAGVVAQLTSPCLQHGHHLELCQKTTSHEVFLLAAAAVANITFLHSQACSMLLQLSAPRLLIQACLAPKARSLFAKDQVATVLANMAAIPACQADIRQQSGVELLVRFLYERPLSPAGPAELAACERVQQKAAIALSRLCHSGSHTEKIIQSKALPRLVELCRHADARNKSDAVLVACLAALRKICSVCGTDQIRPLDLKQLVQPQLMDSFLICSNTDENFV
ncbi:hypothetical protein BaRGS_00011494 [Batillaria attramentaria]|uniref:Protein inscuteable homolog n=1 Tax=Batillaria attramentaria TaxID=370345 RepID=A0ABD0LD16_9CAEN